MDRHVRNFMKHILLLVVAVLFPSLALACSYDTDCAPGSQCLNASGATYGVMRNRHPPGRYSQLSISPVLTEVPS